MESSETRPTIEYMTRFKLMEELKERRKQVDELTVKCKELQISCKKSIDLLEEEVIDNWDGTSSFDGHMKEIEELKNSVDYYNIQ